MVEYEKLEGIAYLSKTIGEKVNAEIRRYSHIVIHKINLFAVIVWALWDL